MEDLEKVNYKKFREKVLQRDKYQCHKCKQEFPTDELDLHHIVPKSHGGPSTLENAQTFCKKHHRVLHKESNTLDEYAFEYKTFNNVSKVLDNYPEEFEEEDYGEPREAKELGDIDIEELEGFDKQKGFEEEV